MKMTFNTLSVWYVYKYVCFGGWRWRYVRRWLRWLPRAGNKCCLGQCVKWWTSHISL